MNSDLFPRFSAAEFARRHAAVRTLMAREHLDALVVYSNSGLSRHNHADIHYLSGFLGNRNNYVVQLQSGDPVLYVQSHNHVPNAREASSIATEWGGADSAETVARHIAGAVPGKGVLGYVGELPIQAYLRWQRDLAGWEFRDATTAFRGLRIVKSDEEIAWLRKGAAYTDAAVRHLVAGIRPGMHEYELGALVEAAGLACGGLPHLYYISSGPQDGSSPCVPRQNLSHRTLARGDIVNIEVSISHWGYSGQAHRPIFVQTEPTELYRRLWECSLEAYHRGIEKLRAGATSEDLLDASASIAERGFTINDGYLHGFGIGLLPPSIGTRASGLGIPRPPFVFEENMCVVLQPNVVTHDERAGVQLGNLLRITRDGTECLHRLPLQYFVSA